MAARSQYSSGLELPVTERCERRGHSSVAVVAGALSEGVIVLAHVPLVVSVARAEGGECRIGHVGVSTLRGSLPA